MRPRSTALFSLTKFGSCSDFWDGLVRLVMHLVGGNELSVSYKISFNVTIPRYIPRRNKAIALLPIEPKIASSIPRFANVNFSSSCS